MRAFIWQATRLLPSLVWGWLHNLIKLIAMAWALCLQVACQANVVVFRTVLRYRLDSGDMALGSAH